MESTVEDKRPILVENEIPRCKTVLEPPPALRDLIEKATKGFRRLLISAVHGRNNTGKVNAISLVGAKHTDHLSGDEIEEVLVLAMRVISSSLEISGTKMVFRCVPFATGRDGKSERGSGRDIPFDGIYDVHIGTPNDERDGNAEHFEMLRYLTAQNRHSLNLQAEGVKQMQAATGMMKGMATYTETVVGRLADALVRERTATDAAAEAQSQTVTASNDHELAMRKVDQQKEFMEMFSPAIQHATSQLGLKAADSLGSGKAKADKVKNPFAKSEKGAEKKTTKKKTTKKKAAKKKATKKKSTKKKAARKTPTSELPDEGSEQSERESEMEALRDEHPHLYALTRLRDSMTEDQEGSIAEALGEEGWACLEEAVQATENDEALDALIQGFAQAPEDATVKVLAALSGEQQAVLGTLKMGCMARQKELEDA